MKVLVISPTPSHPQNAGNRQRIFAMLSRLKQYGHQVHFCFIRREWVADDQLQAMRQAWDGLTLIPYDRKQERRSKGDVWGIDDWFLPSLTAEFTALAAQHQPDVVLVEYVFYSKALDFFPASCLKIIDAHDVFTDRHLRLKEVGLEPAFFWTNAEQERIGLDRADLVLAIQDEERGRLEELTRAAVVTLGFMPEVKGPLPPRSAATAVAPVVGYIGSGNPLNVQAVRHFLQGLDQPAMLAAGAALRIGGGAATALKELPPPAQPVGEVSDLAGFYAGLDLAINPHEGGTGLKIKTVEALAHGLPVIGTAEAFLGLEPEAAFHAAGSAAEVGHFVNRYLQEPAFQDEVAEASRRIARRYTDLVETQLAMFRSLEELRQRLRRPRLLLVTDIAFWHESLGNHARIAEQIRAARSYMDVDVFVFRSLAPKDRAALQRIVGARGQVFSFKAYPGSETRQPIWVEAAKLLAGFEHKSFSRQYFATLEEHLAQQRYDAVVLQYIRLSYLRHVRGMPELSILDIHDVMSLRVKNFALFGLDHFLKIEEREELSILSGFRFILAIQAYEYKYLNAVFPGQAIYFPHALSEVTRRSPPARPKRIIFVGGDSPMNRDGLNWFLQQVWPCFLDRGVELHVAGDVCKTIAQDHPNVVLHGRVDDLKGFLRQADLAINPVYYGGGLKIKTVEYLCYGIPAVLTLEAAFGVPGGEGEAYLLARSRGEFISHLDRLISDPELCRKVSEQAFAFGRRQFGPRALAPGLGAIAAMARALSPAA